MRLENILIELLKNALSNIRDRQKLVDEFQKTIWDYDGPVDNEPVFDILDSLAHDIEFIEDDPNEGKLIKEIEMALTEIEALGSQK